MRSKDDEVGSTSTEVPTTVYRNLKPLMRLVPIEAIFVVFNARWVLDATKPIALRVLFACTGVLLPVGALICWLRAGIRLNSTGVAVRSCYGRTTQSSWSEVDGFRLRRIDRGNERVAVKLNDGRELSTVALTVVDSFAGNDGEKLIARLEAERPDR